MYDALNRLTQKSYPDSSDRRLRLRPGRARCRRSNDPTGTYGFSLRQHGPPDRHHHELQLPHRAQLHERCYTYNAASNRTGFTDPESGLDHLLLRHAEPAEPRWHRPRPSAAGSFGFSYNALSRRTQMTRPNEASRRTTPTTTCRGLTSVLHHLSGESTIDGASYTLDSAGNRTAKVNQN